MKELGAESMSNAELLEMLIGSCTRHDSAVDLAARMIDSVGGDLVKLSHFPPDDFCKFQGVGLAKSSSILAAMELARRMYPMLNVAPARKMRVSGGAVLRPAAG